MSNPSEPTPQDSSYTPHELAVARQSLEQGHETSDVNVRGIITFAVGLITAAVIMHLALYWALLGWGREPLPVRVQVPPVEATPPPAPGPGLEAVPRVEAEMSAGQQAEILTTYGWRDREAGTVRVPITRAMEWLIDPEAAGQEGATPQFGLGPAYQLDSSGGLVPESGDDEE
jgi:hypothetical protein